MVSDEILPCNSNWDPSQVPELVSPDMYFKENFQVKGEVAASEKYKLQQRKPVCA